jgi:hypothetical protein
MCMVYSQNTHVSKGTEPEEEVRWRSDRAVEAEVEAGIGTRRWAGCRSWAIGGGTMWGSCVNRTQEKDVIHTKMSLCLP